MVRWNSTRQALFPKHDISIKNLEGGEEGKLIPEVLDDKIMGVFYTFSKLFYQLILVEHEFIIIQGVSLILPRILKRMFR